MSEEKTGLAKFLYTQKLPIGTIETSIGNLTLFKILYKDLNELASYYKSTNENIPVDKLIRKLVQRVCYTQESLLDGQYRPDNTVLTDEEINHLSSEELESFSAIYIKSDINFRQEIGNLESNDKDGVTGKLETIQKFDNETNLEFLFRLLVDKIKGLVLQTKKFKEFTEPLQKNILAQQLLGEALINSIKADKSHLKPEALFAATSSVDATDTYDVSTLNEKLTNQNKEAFEKPFIELGDKLDNLIALSQDTVRYSIDSNNNLLSITSEINSSSKSADNHARRTISLTLLVIALTVIGLMFTAWSNYSGMSFSKNQNDKFSGFANSLHNSIENNSAKVSENTNAIKAALALITKDLNKSTKLLESTQWKLKNSEREIGKIKKKYLIAQKKIKNLEAELKALKRVNQNQNKK